MGTYKTNLGENGRWRSRVDIWGGVECTLNRVGDQFFSQCERNGHFIRREDIECFANLNIKKIRYPLLWETVCTSPHQYNWDWTDERLSLLRQNHLDPIAGFLHHGSGPSFTNLLDPAFPELFAAYASQFAERYPWVKYYTPIDEILTTARFSCLYGFWYPHKKDDFSFVRALIHQVKATILAMKAIRKFNPEACLIQAEDLGRAQSTEVLDYQRQFENDRRWISMDLLCGRVNAQHPLFEYLRNNGFTADDEQWLKENATPPDIFGLNHYILSNRYLDHRLSEYPSSCHGRNYFHEYADVSSADTEMAKYISPQEIFMEAWLRYKIPLAITEVHIRGHREDQMRWFFQVWNESLELQQQGVDIRAVTAWSLLGSYDWHSLCTRVEGFYEPGVFDLRTQGAVPKPTALAHLIRRLANQEEVSHPILEQPGWWKLRRRLLYSKNSGPVSALQKSRPLIITGGRGNLGQAFARICEQRDLYYILLSREDLDIADFPSVKNTLQTLRPWAVINAAGYGNVDLAETNSAACFRENVLGAKNLALCCADEQILFTTFSSSLVFDGKSSDAYLESHPVSPLNVYGRSKVESEEQVLKVNPKSLIIRTSSFFGPWDQNNFAKRIIDRLRRHEEVPMAYDTKISATYLPDLVHASLDLLLDEEHGLVHLTNQGGKSWSEIAKQFARLASRHNLELDSSLIIERSLDSFNFPAQRPHNSVLASERMNILTDLENAIDRYFCDTNIFQ
jgi:dTDP-4-dehydrorhamnose reductase